MKTTCAKDYQPRKKNYHVIIYDLIVLHCSKFSYNCERLNCEFTNANKL